MDIFGFECQCERCVNEAQWPLVIRLVIYMYGVDWVMEGWRKGYGALR